MEWPLGPHPTQGSQGDFSENLPYGNPCLLKGFLRGNIEYTHGLPWGFIYSSPEDLPGDTHLALEY